MAFALPTEKTQPKADIKDYIVLLYGEPKIGKTTFASQMEDPLFLATEPGHNAVSVYKVDISSWDGFLQSAALIAKGDHQYRTIVIDTVDNLFDRCSEYVRQKHGFQHESDLEFGKGWSLVGEEFKRALTRLALLDYGLVLISHAQEREIKTRTAVTTRWSPTLPNTARKAVLPMVDLILFAQSITTDDGEQRVLRCQPTENWEAGGRVHGLPRAVPLDYQAFHKAFSAAIGGDTQ